ncbi:MAG: hypothetical protein CME62_12025 [Halobacteriovoraceae bacterium]|nr:hypothetical protein [Halobacteriovoraceae bacterium]|tara:strand:- start:36997 stop:38082 length:1086 start_codon:yes stop_codon:yes gene_type:complete
MVKSNDKLYWSDGKKTLFSVEIIKIIEKALGVHTTEKKLAHFLEKFPHSHKVALIKNYYHSNQPFILSPFPFLYNGSLGGTFLNFSSLLSANNLYYRQSNYILSTDLDKDFHSKQDQFLLKFAEKCHLGEFERNKNEKLFLSNGSQKHPITLEKEKGLIFFHQEFELFINERKIEPKKVVISSFHYKRIIKVFEILQNDLSQQTSIVDIGCGSLDFLKLCSEINPKLKCLGIDTQIQPMDSTDKIKVVNKSFTEFEFTQFDILTLIEVIEHLDHSDLDTLILKIKNDIRPKKIVISTPIGAESLKVSNIDHKFEWSASQFKGWIVKNFNTNIVKLEFETLFNPENQRLTQIAVISTNGLIN